MDGLMYAVESCQIRLHEICDWASIPLTHTTQIPETFDTEQHLPQDILLLFAVEVDRALEKYTGQLITEVRKKVFVLGVFLGEETHPDWLHDQILEPNGIALHDNDCALRVYDIPALGRYANAAERALRSILVKTLEQRNKD